MDELVVDAWRRRAAPMLGRRVEWESAGERQTGLAENIDDDGALDREGGCRDAEDQVGRSQVVVEPADQYCRAIEAYLCRKNDGHLIRIVGPAFEQVLGWAARGVPIKIACHGIDRYFERYYAKGPRRRPVRIEFCEADVLDAFDEWRRAVGIASEARLTPATASNAESEPEESTRRQESLPAHLDRVIARLTTLRAGADRSLDAGHRCGDPGTGCSSLRGQGLFAETRAASSSIGLRVTR